MNFHAIGDLAQSLASRRHSASLQSELTRLTQELSSGKTTNVARHLNGHFDQLADIENQIVLNAAYKAFGTEAATRATMMQDALGHVHGQLAEITDAALLISGLNDASAVASTSVRAREALNSIVSALNTEVAGRPVFAGTAVEKAPLVSGAAVMDAARAAVAGAGDADAVIAALDTFFNTPGGGYESIIYQGGKQNLAPFRLGEGESVQLAIRADDPILRKVLKDTVMAALAGEASLSLSNGDRTALLREAAGGMRVQMDSVTQLRGDLGFAEERIGQAIARNASEGTALQIARGELLEVNRVETASALQQVQLQLETVYTLTARLSRLNLVNFL